MALNSATNVAPSSDLLAAVNAKKPTTGGTETVNEATDKFMTLLVTQLKNQDPLNPLDNAQITSQLAQLSTVTGVNKLNDTMESLKASYRSSESLAATNMIGHGVLVDGSDMQLRGGQGLLGVELDSPADDVKVIVVDAITGREVHTITLGSQKEGIVPIAWDGVVEGAALDADGNPVKLPDGAYTFRVVATRSGQALTDARPLQFDSVMSVSTSAKDGVKLNLPYKGSVTMADIKQIL